MDGPPYPAGTLVAERKDGQTFRDGSRYHILKSEPLLNISGNQYYSYVVGQINLFNRLVIGNVFSSDGFPLNIEISVCASIPDGENLIPGTLDKWKRLGLLPAPSPSKSKETAFNFKGVLTARARESVQKLSGETARRHTAMALFKKPNDFESTLKNSAERILDGLGLRLDLLLVFNIEDTIGFKARFSIGFLQNSMVLASAHLEGRSQDPGFAARPELPMDEYLETVGVHLARYLDLIFTYTPYNPDSWRIRAGEIDASVRDFHLYLDIVSKAKRLTGELPVEYREYLGLIEAWKTRYEQWSKEDPQHLRSISDESKPYTDGQVKKLMALRNRLVTGNGKRSYGWLD